MPILQALDNELIIYEEGFSFSFHFSNILCRTLLLGLFPDFRASCDRMKGNKEDITFWDLHTLQYLDYKAEVVGKRYI